MNETYVYVFIRTDIPAEQQVVQSCHAVFHMAELYIPDRQTPNIIVIGVPHLTALNRVKTKLQANQIPHYAWTEPDFDMGETAIATVPLDSEQREVLKNYRVLRLKTDNSDFIEIHV